MDGVSSYPVFDFENHIVDSERLFLFGKLEPESLKHRKQALLDSFDGLVLVAKDEVSLIVALDAHLNRSGGPLLLKHLFCCFNY